MTWIRQRRPSLTLAKQETQRIARLVDDMPLPIVFGYADRLWQVLPNILDNALKYAGADDNITVSLKTAEPGILCAICGSGPGIPARHLPHVTSRVEVAAGAKEQSLDPPHNE